MENTAPTGPQEAKVGVREKAQLMSGSEIDRTLLRLAYEIVERHDGAEGLVFVGVKRRGAPLAERLLAGKDSPASVAAKLQKAYKTGQAQ